MGLYRDESGQLLEIDDAFAEARGYIPAHPAELGALIDAEADRARGEDRGIVGDINAAATGLASGMTLGLSDVLLGESLPPLERERLQAELEANPNLRAGGEIVGAVAGGFAVPGGALAKTPAGYLGARTATAVEQNLARGGVAGTAKALSAMGVEGAIQSTGQYIGHSAIEDKEVTAEGLAGSLGTGYAFGGVGGGAALGVVKGTMAARRMFSRAMDGERAAKAAESSWSLTRQEALDADAATLRAAEMKLDEIKRAKIEAQRGRNEAGAVLREERIRASDGMPPRDVSDGVPVSEMEGPDPLIDVGPQPAGSVTRPRGVPVELPPGSVTKKIVREPATELEGQLAGTKAKLDEGAALRDVKPIKAGKGNDSDSIAKWLDEKKAFDDGVELEDIRGAAALRNRRQTALREIRFKATEDLLGPQMAKMERELQEVVDEYNEAVAGVGELSDGIPTAIDVAAVKPRRPGATTPGKRAARQIVDDAHEEALLRAKYGANPQEAGSAIREAHELERLLDQIDDVSDGVPRAVDASPEDMFADQLAADIKKLWRYEEASAKLADVIGEVSHPTSIARAKALRDAAKDSERKLMDRMARGVEDAETFGPTYKTPKERVNYARERLSDAQSRVDELGVQEKEAREALSKAGKAVREGERTKKAALRVDEKVASKLGAAEVGGVWEIADLPGLPKPSDLPVVGPLLGAYLKYRTLKRAMGGVMGRVPATADAKVAARAAQTRDRIARAVDRSLGVIERTGKYAVRAMPPASAVLAQRIFDDGGEDPGPKAPIQKQAAARMREISAYVHTPGAIERDVRFQLQGVTDPDLIAAAEQHRRFMFEYILKHMPKMPEQGILKTHDWEPSPAQAMSLARQLDTVNDPPAAFERMAQGKDLVSLESADILRNAYPRLFQEALRRAVERAGETEAKIPYRTRLQMTLFYKLPFESALEPENIQITQSVYERKPSSPALPGAAAPPPSVPQPSVAQPTNLAQEYMPSFDRR